MGAQKSQAKRLTNCRLEGIPLTRTVIIQHTVHFVK